MLSRMFEVTLKKYVHYTSEFFYYVCMYVCMPANEKPHGSNEWGETATTSYR